jgi:hypothetical protein
MNLTPDMATVKRELRFERQGGQWVVKQRHGRILRQRDGDPTSDKSLQELGPAGGPAATEA